VEGVGEADFLFDGRGDDGVDNGAEGGDVVTGHPEGELEEGGGEEDAGVVDGEEIFYFGGGVGGGGVDGDDVAVVGFVVFAEGDADTLADGQGGQEGVGDGVVEDFVEGAFDGDGGEGAIEGRSPGCGNLEVGEEGGGHVGNVIGSGWRNDRRIFGVRK